MLTWWNADPVTLALLVVLLGGYLLAIGPLRDRLLPGVARVTWAHRGVS